MDWKRAGFRSYAAEAAGHAIEIRKHKGEWILNLDGHKVGGASNEAGVRMLAEALPHNNWSPVAALKSLGGGDAGR